MVAAEEKEPMAAAPGDATVKPGGGVVQAPSQLQAPRPEMVRQPDTLHRDKFWANKNQQIQNLTKHFLYENNGYNSI